MYPEPVKEFVKQVKADVRFINVSIGVFTFFLMVSIFAIGCMTLPPIMEKFDKAMASLTQANKDLHSMVVAVIIYIVFVLIGVLFLAGAGWNRGNSGYKK
jgi:hypothetical protein